MFGSGDEVTSGGIAPTGGGGVYAAEASGPRAPAGNPAMPAAPAVDAAPPAPADARDRQIAGEVAAFRPFGVLFNQPSLLPFGKPTLIRFVIASKDLEEAKAEFGETTGEVVTGQARLGRQVRAQLSGPGDDVQIESVGKDVRDINGATNATFEWYVTPKTAEPFKLTLRLYNRVWDGTQWVELQQPPYVKEFQVSVSAAQKVQMLLSEINGWLALLGSSILAVLGFAFTRLKARFEKKPDPAK